MKKLVWSFVFLILAGAAPALAGPIGPLDSSTASGIYLGAGYLRSSIDLEGQDGVLGEPEASQNRLFLQLGLKLRHGWETYLRGGVADLTLEDAFLFSDDEFSDDFLPYGTVGLKAPLFLGKALEIGLFVEGSYFSKYEDVNPGVTVEAGTGTEEMFLDNGWEASAGLIFQTMLEGAYLYGGPFFYMAEADARTVTRAGGFTDPRKDALEAQDSLGAFLGVRWPLKNGLRIDLEGQLKSGFAAGTAITYVF